MSPGFSPAFFLPEPSRQSLKRLIYLILGRFLGPAQGLTAIAERLGNMDARHLVLAVEVGQRARHPKRAVITAGAERQRVGSLAQQRQPGAIWRGDLLEQRAVAFGIGADAGQSSVA